MAKTDDNYIERLEKIVDNQDNLLNHFDSRLEQANSVNKLLRAENDYLHEDLKEHKKLLIDMKKALKQHENVIASLKKELEGQLEIQQNLHEEYGEIIEKLENENKSAVEVTNNDSNNDKVQLPPKEFENEPIKSVKNTVASFANNINLTNPTNNIQCPKCGTSLGPNTKFCHECGNKIN